MTIRLRVFLPTLALLFATWATATDLPFYEAQRVCMAVAEPHPFELRLSLSRPSGPSYSIEPESAFTQCLREAAKPTEPDGARRRLSLEANLTRAVTECSSGTTEKPRELALRYSLNERGYFNARVTPSQTIRVENCILMITNLTQAMGAK